MSNKKCLNRSSLNIIFSPSFENNGCIVGIDVGIKEFTSIAFAIHICGDRAKGKCSNVVVAERKIS